jgi:hypothetical protein
MVYKINLKRFPIRCTDVIILNELQATTISASEYLQCSTDLCTSFVNMFTYGSIVHFICYMSTHLQTNLYLQLINKALSLTCENK